MRRTSILILTLVALGAAFTAGAAATTGRAPKATLVVLHTHRYGAILADGNGYTIYGFAIDKRKKDVCQAAPGCLGVWPPVLAPHKLVLGRGVRRSLVGSIRLRDGRKQLTYHGWPLYHYVLDTRPKQTSHINIVQFGGAWPAVKARTGKFVPAPPVGG